MKTFLHAKFLFPCLHSLAIAFAIRVYRPAPVK